MIRLERASKEAVRYALLKLHYAKTVCVNQVAYSVFENDIFCGVIAFGIGANPNYATSLKVNRGEYLELVRVALNGKQTTTSQCLAVAIRLLKKENPQVKILVSYADSAQNHLGTIYQATNWIYLGDDTCKTQNFIYNGKLFHRKTLASKYNLSSIKSVASEVPQSRKHKYIYCYDKDLLNYWKQFSKPYPKKCGSSVTGGTPTFQVGGSVQIDSAAQ